MVGTRALITGVGGQDGQLLAIELSRRGWRITGAVIPGSLELRPESLTELPSLEIIEADLRDIDSCRRVIADARPDIVFHLAAVSSVATSWSDPLTTAQVNGLASVALMDECHRLSKRTGRPVRFVHASSAEIFAGTDQVPQDEGTPLCPLSPYGASKAFAHTMADTFRSNGLWVSNAILYNHESPLRPLGFVTRKITAAAAAIASGSGAPLVLGNLDTRRDWGWAPDYVDALVRIAMHDHPDNFVIATGISRSVRDFVTAAFEAVGIDDWSRHVQFDAQFARPVEGVELVGDAAKARNELGWRTTKTFSEIVAAMVIADVKIIEESRDNMSNAQGANG